MLDDKAAPPPDEELIAFVDALKEKEATLPVSDDAFCGNTIQPVQRGYRAPELVEAPIQERSTDEKITTLASHGAATEVRLNTLSKNVYTDINALSDSLDELWTDEQELSVSVMEHSIATGERFDSIETESTRCLENHADYIESHERKILRLEKALRTETQRRAESDDFYYERTNELLKRVNELTASLAAIASAAATFANEGGERA